VTLLRTLSLHRRVRRDVERHATGFIGVKTLIMWRERTILSISLWENLESIYSMGSVERHILATRRTGPLGIDTSSGVFPFAGDWRRVMFRSSCESCSPLNALQKSQPTERNGGTNAHPN
jgi:hypothetical protein